MNLPVKAPVARLLIIPNEIMIESSKSCLRVVRTSKVCADIIVLYQTNLCRYHFPNKLPRASLKGINAALLMLTRILHGCSLLENSGAYSSE